MGSVRQQSWRQYLPFLGLNVAVSAATVLCVLTLWGRGEGLPEPIATPTIDVAQRLADAIPTATPTLPPSPTPVTYTVQSGDTLGAIAAELDIAIEDLMAANGLTNPDALSVGQALIIPQEGEPLPATPTPPGVEITVTPEGLPQVIIRGAYETGELQTEFVYLENVGGVATMAEWTLDDGRGTEFVFPSFTLYKNGGVNVYTRAGQNSVINLYWGMDQPLWEPGTLITLRDAAGQVQSTFRVP